MHCQNVFSTKESADLAQALRMELSDGNLVPFDTYILFISLYESLKHRDDPISDAHQLLDTVISDLLKLKLAIIPRHIIINTASGVLKRFDKVSYIQYKAFHKL